MIPLTVILPFTKIGASNNAYLDEIKKLESRKGLNAAKIGKLIAQKRGGDNKTHAAHYGFFRRGERRIADSLLPVLAEIFEVGEEEIHLINANFVCQDRVQLEFDPKLNLDDFLGSVPNDYKELGKFLIWLSTENERRELAGHLASK